MPTFPTQRAYQLVSFFVIITVLATTSHFAQTAEKTFDVELIVTEGKKSVETDADIIFKDKTFVVMPDKTNFKSSAKELAYADLKRADHSFSKKPMLSGGGAVATALLVGVIFAVPFLFIKKKKHWMTVQTETEYAVIKLGDRNFRQIVAEFETHGVKVADLGDESKKQKAEK